MFRNAEVAESQAKPNPCAPAQPRGQSDAARQLMGVGMEGWLRGVWYIPIPAHSRLFRLRGQEGCTWHDSVLGAGEGNGN